MDLHGYTFSSCAPLQGRDIGISAVHGRAPANGHNHGHHTECPARPGGVKENYSLKFGRIRVSSDLRILRFAAHGR
jgi:hypothetical protein